MRIIDLRQNSKDWHAWRNKGLGASDAPIIMGDSKWTTPFQLWAEKTGLLPRQEMNQYAIAAMERGKKLEPEALQRYSALTGKAMTTLVAEDDHQPYLRVSLDGWEASNPAGHIVEIKCPGQEAHDIAKGNTKRPGRVPEYYWAQVQQQILVTGAATCDYFSYRPGDERPEVIIPVIPHQAYQTQLREQTAIFWQYVKSEGPPPLSKKDFVRIFDEMSRAINTLTSLRKVFQAIHGVSDLVKI